MHLTVKEDEAKGPNLIKLADTLLEGQEIQIRDLAETRLHTV